MHVSICIVTFRNADEAAQCVEALAGSNHADFDVVINENGGDAAFNELIATIPDLLPGGQKITFLNAGANLGYAGGVNACLAARPESDAWWVLNPDTVPAPDALTALVARHAETGCNAVGSMLHHADGTVQAYGGYWRKWIARAESIGQGGRLGDAPDVAAIEARMNYILGASILLDRRFLETVGPMRDDYFLYCEEVEWAQRAIARGIRLGFAANSRVMHGQGGTTGSGGPIRSRRKLPIYLDERNKLNVVRDTGLHRFPVAAISTVLLLSLRYALRGAWRQWGYALAGWWAGIKGERGAPDWL